MIDAIGNGFMSGAKSWAFESHQVRIRFRSGLDIDTQRSVIYFKRKL